MPETGTLCQYRIIQPRKVSIVHPSRGTAYSPNGYSRTPREEGPQGGSRWRPEGRSGESPGVYCSARHSCSMSVTSWTAALTSAERPSPNSMVAGWIPITVTRQPTSRAT